MTRKIIGTATITFACLFLIFSYGIGLFGFLFPAPMVWFTKDLGLAASADMFADREYTRNPNNIDVLRYLLERAVLTEKHERVIILAPRYIEHYVNNDQPVPTWAIQAYLYSRIELGLPINEEGGDDD